MGKNSRVVVGQMFVIPLFEVGFAFGYVSLINKAVAHLCSVFDLVSDTADLPADLMTKPLALEDLPVTGTEFTRQKAFPDKQWRLTDRRMPEPVRATRTRFIMQSRPAFQIIDLADGAFKRRATDDEIANHPPMTVRFPPFTTKQVEVAVRHLDIEPGMIGTGCGDASLH